MRKDCWDRLTNLKQADWKQFAFDNNLPITTPSGGTSHTCTIRDPLFPNSSDPRHLVTVQVRLHKVANQKIFKKLMTFGFSEDEIFRAFRFIK